MKSPNELGKWERAKLRAKITELRAQGYSYPQIAEQTGYSLKRIEMYASKLAKRQKEQKSDVDDLRVTEWHMRSDAIYSSCMDAYRECRATGEEIPGDKYLKLAAQLQEISRQALGIDEKASRRLAARATEPKQTTNITINTNPMDRIQQLLDSASKPDPLLIDLEANG